MEVWDYVFIAGISVLAVLIAIPLGVGICLVVGGILMLVMRLTLRCPGCRQKCIRVKNGWRGIGFLYECIACNRQWSSSNNHHAWQDASSPEFQWLFANHSEQSD